MFKWVGYILLLALVVAIFTAPSEEKFKKFAEGKAGNSTCKPYVDYRPYKVVVTFFGIGHIEECKRTGIYNSKTGQTVGNAIFPVYGKSQTYLGLFGTFWKL